MARRCRAQRSRFVWSIALCILAAMGFLIEESIALHRKLSTEHLPGQVTRRHRPRHALRNGLRLRGIFVFSDYHELLRCNAYGSHGKCG